MSGVEPHRGRRSAYVAGVVRDLIVSGDLLPGSRINERVIGEQFGISRTPLREAFKILESQGLVTIKPNAGATVVAMSYEDVEASIEVLIGLESIGAEQAAVRATPEAIDEIASLHHAMCEAFRDSDLMGYFHLNQEIHQKIIDASSNAALSRIYASESVRIKRFRFVGNRDRERWQRAISEHEQILDALRRREGRLLREILRTHHLSGWKAARRALEAMDREGLDGSNVE